MRRAFRCPDHVQIIDIRLHGAYAWNPSKFQHYSFKIAENIALAGKCGQTDPQTNQIDWQTDRRTRNQICSVGSETKNGCGNFHFGVGGVLQRLFPPVSEYKLPVLCCETIIQEWIMTHDRWCSLHLVSYFSFQGSTLEWKISNSGPRFTYTVSVLLNHLPGLPGAWETACDLPITRKRRIKIIASAPKSNNWIAGREQRWIRRAFPSFEREVSFKILVSRVI